LPVGDGLDLLAEVFERLDNHTAGATRRIEHRLTEARINDLHHEANDRARRVYLAGIARRIAHLAEHGFVERAKRVKLAAGSEMDAGDLVDDVAQQVAADHAILHAAKHGGDHIPAIVAVVAGEPAQVAEQPRALRAIGPRRLFVVDESEQFIAGDALRIRRPIPPAVRRFERRLKLLSRQLRLLLALQFEVIEKLQKHDPSQQRQPVKVAIQPLVLAHYVPRGFLSSEPRDWAVVAETADFFTIKEIVAQGWTISGSPGRWKERKLSKSSV
jgi:hypothetical protein